MAASRNSRLITVMTVFALAIALLATAPSFCSASGGRRQLLENVVSIGSTPPDCTGKCNGCTPCVAVPSPHGGPPHSGGPPPPPPSSVAAIDYIRFDEEVPPYKPIIWMCKCQPKAA